MICLTNTIPRTFEYTIELCVYMYKKKRKTRFDENDDQKHNEEANVTASQETHHFVQRAS